jgi:DNA adenine methylase
VLVSVRQSFFGRQFDSWGYAVKALGGAMSRAFHNFADKIPAISERMRGIYIDNDSYEAIIERYDSDVCLFYCDPPYLNRLDQKRATYEHEMITEADHVKLLTLLLNTKGKAAISGYDSDLYNDMLKGWRKTTIQKRIGVGVGNTKGLATECLWMNYEPQQENKGLFGDGLI